MKSKISAHFYKTFSLFIVLTLMFFGTTRTSNAQSVFAPRGITQNQNQAIIAQPLTEEIWSYTSQIEIAKNGSIIVQETIGILATGDKVKHGIYRDLPFTKGIEIVSIQKNGIKEPYTIQTNSTGIRVYIGSPSTALITGTYTYRIIYTVESQVRFFSDHDELYWNVTGNDWEFPIQNSSVIVKVPANAPNDKFKSIGYVGIKGSKEQANSFVIYKDGENTVVTGKTERPLKAQEGYTVAVSWPKGYITGPSATQQFLDNLIYFLPDIIGIGMVLSLAIFYYLVWRKVGRDEGDTGIVTVQFEPPKNLTPAQIRAIDNMGDYDAVCFSTALLNIAIQGYVKITEKRNGDYLIERTAKNFNDLKAEEQLIYLEFFPNAQWPYDPQNPPEQPVVKRTGLEAFFENITLLEKPDPLGTYTIGLRNNYSMIRIKEKLTKMFASAKKNYIVTNRKYMVWALIPLSIFAGTNILLRGSTQIFFMFFSTFWSLIVSVFLANAVGMWISLKKEFNGTMFAQAIYLTIFLTPFVGVAIFTGYMAWGLTGMIYMGLAAAINGIAFKALPRRNRMAREIQDRIDGFKMFLTGQAEYIAGVEMNIPEKFTMYEKYLPYAIALDVGTSWSEKFKDTFEKMSTEQMNQSAGWYTSSSGMHAITALNIASFSNSFTSAISNSSTAQSHSSGGMSGGSSGGGGGGGGGGGW